MTEFAFIALLAAGPSPLAFDAIAAQCQSEAERAAVSEFLAAYCKPKARRGADPRKLAGCIRTFKEKRRARWIREAALGAAYAFAPEIDENIIRDAIDGKLGPSTRAEITREFRETSD